MKILILLLTLFSVSFAQKTKPATAPAAKPVAKAKAYSRPYGMAGCGLGSMVVGKNGGQVTAGTTNGSSSNQYFGITTGTLNCIDDSASEVAHKMDK